MQEPTPEDRIAVALEQIADALEASQSRFRVQIKNHMGHSICIETDIGENVIPAGESMRVSFRPASCADAFYAADRPRQLARIPIDGEV